MAEIDSLEIIIESDAKKANRELDKLIARLDYVSRTLQKITGNNNFKNLIGSTKAISSNFKEISNSAKKTAENISKPIEQAAKDISERIAKVNDQYKDVGKDFKFTGSFEQARKKIAQFENSLQTAKDKVKSFEDSNRVFGTMYERAVEDVSKYTNRIEVLRNKLESTSKVEPLKNINARDISKELDSIYADFNRIEKQLSAGLFDKMDLKPSELKLQTNIIKELEDSLSRLESTKLDSTNAEFKRWKDTIDEVRYSLEYAKEQSKIPKNIISTENFIPQYNKEAMKFVENYSSDIEKIKSKSEELREEIEKFQSSFKPTELGIGEAYSKEFLEIQKGAAKVQKVLDGLYYRQNRSEDIGGKPGKVLSYDIDFNQNKLRQYQEQMKQLQETGADVIREQISGFDNISNSISNAGTVLSRFAALFRALGVTDISEPMQKWSLVANQTGEAIGKIGAETGTASAGVAGIGSSMAAIGPYALAVVAVIAKIVMQVKILQFEINAVVGGVKLLTKGFTTLWGTVGKVAKSILTIGASSHQALTPVGKLADKIVGIFKTRVLRQAMTKAFSYVEEGFEDLNEYSKTVGSDFHGNMSLLYSDLKLLGRTIATAFEPLINYAAPMLDFIIRKVIDLVNVVAQAFASLTGASSWTKATFALEEWGDAAKNAGGAAKKASKQLRAFDEINNITTNDGGGSGGGGVTTPDVENMFDTVPIDEKIQNFVDRLKESWELADFTWLGEGLASKITDSLNNIPWSDIHYGAFKIGRSLATFINGTVEFPELATTIGDGIAQAINTAIEGFDGFVSNLHFDSIGTFVGESVGTALDNIDWDAWIGDMGTLGEGINKAISALADTGVIQKIGEATFKLISGGINFVWGLLKDPKTFKKLGTEFGKSINKFIKNLTVEDESGKSVVDKIGESINNASGGLTGFIIEAFENIDWNEVSNTVFELCKKIDWKGLIVNLIIVIAEIKKALFNLAFSIYSGIQRYIWEPIVETFLKIKKKFREVMDWLVEKVANGIQTIWQNIQTSSDWVVTKVGDAFTKAWDKVKNAWSGVKQFFSDTFGNVNTNATTSSTKVSTAFTTAWDKIKNVWNVATGFFETVVNSIKNKFSSIPEWFRTTFTNAWQNVKNVFSSGGTIFNGIKDGILNGLKTVINGLIGGINTVIAQPFNNLNSALRTIKNIKIGNLQPFKNKIFEISVPKIPTFATGGFPEDGWFRANRGEVIGQFDNGKTAVANNEQITQGIANAVYEGNKENNNLMRQQNSLLRRQNELLARFIETNADKGTSSNFNTIRQEAYDYYNRTGNSPFPA